MPAAETVPALLQRGAAVTKQTRYHEVGAVLAIALFMIYIALLFARPR